MTVLALLAAGLVAGWLAWVAGGHLFDAPLFARQNHRGATVPVAAGLLAVLASVAVTAVAVTIAAGPWDLDPTARSSLLTTLLASLGFAVLGLLDDLAGAAGTKGFRGHVRSLLHGRPSTGALKLVGGSLVAIVAVDTGTGSPRGIGWLLADAALIALGANLANLFDRAPGRCTKVGLVSLAVLVAATGADPALAGPALLIGAVGGLLVPDLRERLMLGDTGSNPLGAACGLAVVLTAPASVRLGVLAGLVLLNGASELVSFSRVIERVPPLRALDRLGRRPSDLA